MSTETHTQIASFIWGICNLLRGPYKRNEYRKVILPLTVLRRFDSILAPTKPQVLKEHIAIKAKGENIIAAYLDEETAKLDALAGKVEEAIERLQEYRTALITAAVTGKIDVRGTLGVS